MVWDQKKHLLKIDKGVMDEMLETKDNMTIVVVTEQADAYSCDLHSIQCFDAILELL